MILLTLDSFVCRWLAPLSINLLPSMLHLTRHRNNGSLLLVSIQRRQSKTISSASLNEQQFKFSSLCREVTDEARFQGEYLSVLCETILL